MIRNRILHTLTTNLFTACAALLLLFIPRALAEDASALEYRVKAVCLYNFAKYVKWPESAFETPQSALKLCILGTNPFGNLFDDANGKTTQNRPLNVTFIAKAEKTADVKGCNILFWAAKDDEKYSSIVNSLESEPVLTVSEVEGRGIVSFFLEDGKVRFAISLAKAKKAALVISSQLLKLAKIEDEE